MKNQDVEDSTRESYHNTWTNFLNFLQEFDELPNNWEDKMVMYAAHLGNTGTGPATISSYMSAIRYKLRKDGFKISEHSLEIASIIRSAKKLNNRMILREPIHKHMLKQLLDVAEAHFKQVGQLYLCKLYRAMLVTAYYGFMRIGEITDSKHVFKEKDLHISTNKKTILIILRSSKTHNEGDRPFEIRIPQVVDVPEQPDHDPFELIRLYKLNRPDTPANAQFFVFADGSPVKHFHFRKILKLTLRLANFDQDIHDCHSMRSGRCSDLLSAGVPLAIVKKWGRWKDDQTAMKYFRG